MKKWTRWLPGMLAILVLGALIYGANQSTVTFSHLCDAKNRLRGAGFQCTSDCENGTLGSGFLLSHQSVSWGEAGTLCKIGQMGPEWKGKVWVTFNSCRWQLKTLPENAGVRVWGSVIAFGDQDLLNEVDGVL